MIRLYLLFGLVALTFCNVSKEIVPAIINGEIAALRQFPFVVSVRRAHINGHLGGGTMISANWILTAATVVSNFRQPFECVVASGIIDVSVPVTAPGLNSKAVELRLHPKFRFNGLIPLNNIGLIRVLDIPCSGARSGVCGPVFMVRAVQPPTFTGTAIGWGPTSAQRQQNSLLRFATVNGVEECDNEPYSKMCATNVLCSTDIGGPLVTVNGLIGVASYSECDRENSTDMYSRVSHYIDWIISTTGIRT